MSGYLPGSWTDWERRAKAAESENKVMREALVEIVQASRDEGLAYMCNWMRGRAAHALGVVAELRGTHNDSYGAPA